MNYRSSLLAGMFLLSQLLAGSPALAETPPVNGDPVIQADGSTRFTIQGEFRPSLISARESALQIARERMLDWLAKQNPPIRRVPSLDTIRREMIRHEEPPQQEQILNRSDSMYKITMEVDLQPKHIRALRERDRIVTGLWTLGGLLALLGIAALLLRIDEWSKGYLTRSLIASGAAAVIVLAVAWWFIR